MNQSSSSPTVQLVLRYRASADVLTGVVESTSSVGASTAPLESEQPDTDTTVTWRSVDGRPVLAEFQVVHALSRWESDRLPMLPAAVSQLAQTFMATAIATTTEADSPIARLRARSEQRFDVPITELEQPGSRNRPTERGTFQDAVAVADALRELAAALEASVLPEADAEFTLEAERCFVTSRLLEELAGSIADGEGLPARGTSAATRAAVRGGLPLSTGERETLRAALTDIDHPSQWPVACITLRSLTRKLTSHVDRAPHRHD
jgi:hypothetical protein